jgi:citrate lyase subunit beta/citryl-CoA lyase
VAAIDAPSGDLDGLAADCAAAVCDGFSGKLALHPGQVPVINAAFARSGRSRAS